MMENISNESPDWFCVELPQLLNVTSWSQMNQVRYHVMVVAGVPPHLHIIDHPNNIYKYIYGLVTLYFKIVSIFGCNY